jgi:hypothetical protein
MKATLEIDNKPTTCSVVKRRKWWRVGLEIALLPCLAIVGLEGFFRLTQVGEGEFLQPEPVLGTVHIPNKYVTWRLEGYSHDKLSADGFRDVMHTQAKPAGVTRIALLGDSATEGLQVPLEKTYGRVLEQSLNHDAENSKSGKRFEVMNFGCSGYSTGQQLFQYERQVRNYHPDIVVLMYNRGDNIENVFVPGPASTIPPRPYFKMDDKGNVVADYSVMEMNKEKLSPNSYVSFMRLHSRIFGVFSQQNLMLNINEPLYRKLNRLYAKMQFSKSAVVTNRFVRPSYPLQDPWLVTTKLIDRLRSDISADGGHFVLLLFPNSMKDQEYAVQETAFEKDSRARGFDMVSLTPVFSASPDLKNLFLQYHFSDRGHLVVAQVVRDYLVNQLHVLK